MQLPDALVVRVTDASGHGVPSIVVTFHVVSGGGSLFSEATQSNSDGRAQTLFTLGGSVTDEHRVEARVTDATNGGTQLVTTFTGVARPGAAAHILLAPTFEALCVEAGTVAPQPPAILVVDAYENPVPAAPVTFTPGENSGSVSGGDQTTGPDGTAAPTAWVVGTLGGQWYLPNAGQIVATVPGADNSPLEFVGASVVANTPAEVRLDAAPPATAPSGSSVDVRTTVLDAYGNVVDQRVNFRCVPFDRVTVDWEVIEGNGCLPFPGPCATTVGTQRYPFHDMIWSLGPTPGVNRLRVTVRGHPEVVPLTITVNGT